MPPGIHRLARALTLALPWLALGPLPLPGQFRDARVPEPGRLWFEITPTLLDWSEQFARDPSDESVADGDREPLAAHFDGSVAARLFPGPDLFLADLNADATALGFDPVAESDFSLGRLDYGAVAAQVRRLEVGFEMGVFGGLSVGARAPFTMTQVEAPFSFDSLAATVAYADRAIPPGGSFFTEARQALTDLDDLIATGSLAGQELADALALRDGTDTFLTALERRSMEGAFIPTVGSAPGMQMDARYAGFVSGFDGFGLVLPVLALPTARRSDLLRLFEEEPLSAFPPGSVENALDLGEVELSARWGLIDQITLRPEEGGGDAPAADTAAAAGETPADTTAAPAGREAGPPEAGESPDEGRPTLRLRTAVGATLRVPIRSPSLPPLQNAAHFLDVPIGDGQTDIELALYQDIAVGDWLLLRSSALYGVQRPDEVVLRVAPPDRPFAFSSLQTVVERDLGDYLAILVRPGLRLNSTITLGLEYDYFRLGAPTYALTEPLPDAPDASPLELEASETRHRVGIGFVYDLSEARDREAMIEGRRPAGPSWQFGISIRRAVSGSGGRTPASFRFGAHFRVPIRIY